MLNSAWVYTPGVFLYLDNVDHNIYCFSYISIGAKYEKRLFNCIFIIPATCRES